MDLTKNPRLTECLRCRNVWTRRKPINDIKTCPDCKSPYWDTPRKVDKK